MSKYFKLALQDNSPATNVNDYCKKYGYNPVLTLVSETLDVSIAIAERYAGNKLEIFVLVFSRRNVLSYRFTGKKIYIDSLKENKEKKLTINVSMYEYGAVLKLDLVEELNILQESSDNHEEQPSDDLRKAVDSISCCETECKSRVLLSDLVTICSEIKNIPVTHVDIDTSNLITILRQLNLGT